MSSDRSWDLLDLTLSSYDTIRSWYEPLNSSRRASDGIPNVGVEKDELEIEMTLGENKNVNEAAVIFDGMAM